MTNIKPKKIWSKPEIYILDCPQGGTSNTKVHEATAHKTGQPAAVLGTASNQFIRNQPGSASTSFQNAVS